MLQIESRMEAFLCDTFLCAHNQECIAALKVPLDREQSWFETCNFDVFPCWSDDSALQKAKIIKHSTISNSSTIVKVFVQLKQTRNMLGQYSTQIHQVLLFKNDWSHTIMWHSSATKQNSKYYVGSLCLWFSYLPDWVSCIRCDISIFNLVKHDTELFFLSNYTAYLGHYTRLSWPCALLWV